MLETRVAGVVGFPVEHSLSPEIFRILSKGARTPLEYRKLPIRPREFRKVLQETVRTAKFLGWNVTIPHKETAARVVDRLDPLAASLGAVNVIDFKKGRSKGYNTDVHGILQALRTHGFNARGKKAVLYGAGGAAAAAAFALGSGKIGEVVLANRTPRKARALAARVRKSFPRSRFVVSVSGDARVPADADLYINATPCGMAGFPRSPALPRKFSSEDRVFVFDLVYRPLETAFLRAGRRRGAVVISGIEMLVAQAIATWEIWFGPIGTAELRSKLQRRIERHLEGLLEKPCL